MKNRYGRERRLQAIQSLIGRGANVNARCQAFGNSALHLLLANLALDYVRSDTYVNRVIDLIVIFLKAGANINATNAAGFRAEAVARQSPHARNAWDKACMSYLQQKRSYLKSERQSVESRGAINRWLFAYQHFSVRGCWPGACETPTRCFWWRTFGRDF